MTDSETESFVVILYEFRWMTDIANWLARRLEEEEVKGRHVKTVASVERIFLQAIPKVPRGARSIIVIAIFLDSENLPSEKAINGLRSWAKTNPLASLHVLNAKRFLTESDIILSEIPKKCIRQFTSKRHRVDEAEPASAHVGTVIPTEDRQKGGEVTVTQDPLSKGRRRLAVMGASVWPPRLNAHRLSSLPASHGKCQPTRLSRRAMLDEASSERST